MRDFENNPNEPKEDDDLDFFRNSLKQTSNENPSNESPSNDTNSSENDTIKSMREEMKRKKKGEENGSENEEQSEEPILPENFNFEDLQSQIEKNMENQTKNSNTSDSETQKSEEDNIEKEREVLMSKFFPNGTYEEEEEKVFSSVQDMKEQKQEHVKTVKKEKSNKILLLLVAVVPSAILLLIVVILLGALLNTKSGTTNVATDNTNIDKVPTEQIVKDAELSVSEAQAILEAAKTETDLVAFELDSDGNPIQTINSNIVDESKLATDAFALTQIDDGRISQNEVGDFTFADPATGLSLTYPGKWNEVYGFTEKAKPANVNNVVLIGSDPSINRADNMRISIEETQQTVSAKEYFEHTADLLKENFDEYQLISSGEKTISGGEAMYRVYSWATETKLKNGSYTSKDRVTQYQVYISGQEKMHVITFTARSDKFDANFDTYEEILNSIHVKRR